MVSARVCNVCGKEADAWVLVVVTWPTGSRKGETQGAMLCPEHLERFHESFALSNPRFV